MADLITILSSGSSSGGSSLPMWSTLLMFVPIIAIMYFLMIRPQRKKEKKEQEMRNTLQIGDEIVTAGGIIGIVFSIKDDTVIIETGGDRSKIRIKRYAISQVLTIHDNPEK